jgi:hypothetical protein
MYRVTLKPGHPKGLYHRSGRAFTKEAVYLSEEEIRDDIWLNVEPASDGDKEAPDWPEGAEDLKAHIATLDDAEAVQAIIDWEIEGKERVTVVQDAHERLEELAAAARVQANEPPEGGGD